ncbi:25178_t:CDS:2 [Cetraspora pellucida]|uniref:25178_t:CDS:1 n=1 Tax=Cetraspora pellucida TaxID=1433469 RepID=A0A9N9IFK2_9GLOM|nr:25178_t:CDS:2 [Cetraspora pellucida]
MRNETESQVGSSIIHNFTWIIPNFKKIEALAPRPQCFHSPQWTCNICVFDDNGCSYIPLNWRLKFHPNGNSESSQNSISCYLETIFPIDAQPSSRINVNFYIGFYVPVQQGENRVLKLVKRRSERHEFLKVKPAWGWPSFCSKTVLNCEGNNNANNTEEPEILLPEMIQRTGSVLEDDTLVVHVVIITPNPTGMPDELEESMARLTLNSRTAWTAFSQTLNTPNFSDIKFLVEGRTILAHQVILAERSHYFKTLIKNDWTQEIKESKPVHIQDVDYNTFYYVLHYLYSGTLLEITGDTVSAKITQLKKIFIDAEMRKTLEIDAIHELVEVVISELINLIKMNTWDNLLLFAWERDLVRLRKAVYRFAKQNWIELRESESFKNILRDANVDVVEDLITSVKT